MELRTKDRNALVTAFYSDWKELPACGSKKTPAYESGFAGQPVRLLLNYPN